MLNGSTLLAITGLLGVMAGAISFLFRALLKANENQLASQERTIERLIAERNEAINARDHYKDQMLRQLGRAGRWDDKPPRIERIPSSDPTRESSEK